jgi:aldose 1-epimerase
MHKVKKQKGFTIIEVEKAGLSISFLNYGATIYQLKTKDYQGVLQDIVLQYKNLEDYLENSIYLNGTVGPIAGRVKNGEIIANNKRYTLDKNYVDKHTLHSGKLALTFKYFDFEVEEEEERTIVKFSYHETDNFDYIVRVIYSIYDNLIEIKYEVDALDDFVFNLTNHAYFNLSGDLSEGIRNHIVKLTSKKRHVLDTDLVITNQITEEDLYDFTKVKAVDEALKVLEDTEHLGVDDIFFYPKNNIDEIMAYVYEPKSRRTLEVYSSMDHLVFYTHHHINDLPLKHLNNHQKYYGLCFECEKSPYGFNNKEASNPNIAKGNRYSESIIFKFGTK